MDTNSGLLAMLEEAQLGMSIRSYDITYLKLDISSLGGARLRGEHVQRASVKFAVKGSSENRPRIMIGDIVRYFIPRRRYRGLSYSLTHSLTHSLLM
jgi:hypothetical protein